jgi:hypothetical protein
LLGQEKDMKQRVIAIAPLLVGFYLGGTLASRSPTYASPNAKMHKVATPRTVVDYYLLLPKERQYFEWDTREDLLRIITPPVGVTDIKNGYLLTMGDGAQAATTVCLFKRPDRTYLVAVSANEASDGVWEPWLDFYLYKNGRMVDVTEATLPMRVGKHLGFQLPRYGTTIKVINEAGRRLYDWNWVGGRFRVRRAAR